MGMLNVGGDRQRVEFSFNRLSSWTTMDLGPGTNSTYVSTKRVAIQLGDLQRGPGIALVALPPGGGSPTTAPHGHASDNFRLSLRGTLSMGRDSYSAGEFRLHEGWKPYATDNYSNGPDGGWMLLMFGDRRGTRGQPDVWQQHPERRADLDPDKAGPSALAASWGAVRNAHLNGSFFETESWREYSDGIRVAACLLGDAEKGPLVLMTDTQAGATCFPKSTVSTEVLRIVVRGTCTSDSAVYGVGDGQAQQDGTPWEPAIAGDGGVGELIVFGDRRAVLALDPNNAWESALVDLSRELAEGLMRTSSGAA